MITENERAVPPADPSTDLAAPPAPRVRWAAVVTFLLVAYGGGWLIALPLWRSGGLANPLFLPLGLAVMLTPTLAALVATLVVVRPARPARFLGLAPVRPWRRTAGYALLGFVGVQVLGLLAIGLAWVLGVTPVHLAPGTWPSLVSMQLLGLLVTVAALGEEIGWRGFLLPALRPLGTGRALLLSGLVWGPWHAPLVLLGYNYGTTNPSALIMMTVTTILMGVLFGWLRLRSASVYPSAFAHGALNASGGTLLAVFVPGAAGVAPSVLGWVGWLVVALVVVALVAARSFRWARPGAATS
ncbi:CPBP family intramembrane glutamic endopeptidase [Microlunatus antarcticus]|uniref:Membrane protease YdiL (CAAX protease family) n=1 Tax=Microlunatus antarcticus TaxID=53388 RepID=A0A7W5JY75_9ACTN|nr:type II CAAX endopeptidase family protein [Microlunatus antarcticus]MBB3327857.1 membrane protease YdiL (CAAX protease family) [Microlunatus antarcticus]